MPRRDMYLLVCWLLQVLYGMDMLKELIWNDGLIPYHGASVFDVRLNALLPAIPDWVNKFVSARLMCRRVAIVLIGMHKHHYTRLTGVIDNNVLRLIGKHIWSFQMNDAWIVDVDCSREGETSKLNVTTPTTQIRPIYNT
jgi:hypothetical protein